MRSKLKLPATLLEYVFRWVGYPTPAPTLVFSAAPETKKEIGHCILKLKTIYWNLTKKHLSNMYIVSIALGFAIPYFGVNVSAHCLRYPGRLVELSPPLLLWVSCHICHQLVKEKCHIEHEEPQFHEYRIRCYSQMPK